MIKKISKKITVINTVWKLDKIDSKRVHFVFIVQLICSHKSIISWLYNWKETKIIFFSKSVDKLKFQKKSGKRAINNRLPLFQKWKSILWRIYHLIKRMNVSSKHIIQNAFWNDKKVHFKRRKTYDSFFKFWKEMEKIKVFLPILYFYWLNDVIIENENSTKIF